MERWRSFFGSSGEDLWTIIDRAITIAAIDYPQELRVRRDGFAEKLFVPTIHSLVSSVGDRPALPVTVHQSVHLSAPNLLPLSSSIGEAAAATGSDAQTGACSHSDKEDRREREARSAEQSYEDDVNLLASPGCHVTDSPGAEREKFRQVREISMIKSRIMNPDQTEECTLLSLKRLEDMCISFPALKTTGIGKPVNALRKHASRQVRLIVKRLVSSWKDVVDDWVKKQGEDAAVAYVDSGNIVADDKDLLHLHTNIDSYNDAQSRSAKMSQVLDIKSDNLSTGSALYDGIDQQVLHSKLESEGKNSRSDYQSQRLLQDSSKHSRGQNDMMGLDICCQAPTNPRVQEEEEEEEEEEEGEEDADIFTEEKLKPYPASYRPAIIPKETEVAHQTIPHRRVDFSTTAITKQKLLISKPCLDMRFEAAKRRLHEGYSQAEYAKKQRTVQVLEVENLPKVGQGQGKGVSGPLHGRSGISTK